MTLSELLPKVPNRSHWAARLFSRLCYVASQITSSESVRMQSGEQVDSELQRLIKVSQFLYVFAYWVHKLSHNQSW